MPNSLRCRIKKLGYQGKLSDKDVERIIKGLDTSDAIENIRAEIAENGNSDINTKYVLYVIDKHISGKENE